MNEGNHRDRASACLFLRRGVSFGVIVGLTASVVLALPGNYGMLHTDVLGAWLVPAIGVASGAALALSFGVAWGIAFALIVDLAAGPGIAGPDVLADLAIGLGFTCTLAVRNGLVARLEITLIFGIVLGVIGGLTTGPQGGLTGGRAAEWLSPLWRSASASSP